MIPYVDDPVHPTPSEAATVVVAALALSGHELEPFTRKLTSKMGRGQLTGDEAIVAGEVKAI